MSQSEKCDLAVRIYHNRTDELGYIEHRFNVPMDSIDNRIFENYESKMTTQNFELKFIQTQLKEHFVYNTLDSIQWIATRHNVSQISQIIFDLSRFFRLTLNEGCDVLPLDQVAEILRSYMSLLSVRMDNTIACMVTLPPDLGEEPVVKYMFQPILETAIVHGLAPNGGGSVQVAFPLSDADTLCCVVKDDGTGISKAGLEDIERCLAQNHLNGNYLVLLNIRRQLRLYFGNNYSLSIVSQPGAKTCVTMLFPRKRG